MFQSGSPAGGLCGLLRMLRAGSSVWSSSTSKASMSSSGRALAAYLPHMATAYAAGLTPPVGRRPSPAAPKLQRTEHLPTPSGMSAGSWRLLGMLLRAGGPGPAMRRTGGYVDNVVPTDQEESHDRPSTRPPAARLGVRRRRHRGAAPPGCADQQAAQLLGKVPAPGPRSPRRTPTSSSGSTAPPCSAAASCSPPAACRGSPRRCSPPRSSRRRPSSTPSGTRPTRAQGAEPQPLLQERRPARRPAARRRRHRGPPGPRVAGPARHQGDAP